MGRGLGRPDAVVRIDLAVVDARESGIHTIRLREAPSPHELADLAEAPMRYPVRAMLRDQIVDPTHDVPSRSATISSMTARRSDWWATMPAISAFSAAMSTASRVSSAST